MDRNICFPHSSIVAGTWTVDFFCQRDDEVPLFKTGFYHVHSSVLTRFIGLIFIATNYCTSIFLCTIFCVKMYTCFFFVLKYPYIYFTAQVTNEKNNFKAYFSPYYFINFFPLFLTT